jgi:hypothetical protein
MTLVTPPACGRVSSRRRAHHSTDALIMSRIHLVALAFPLVLAGCSTSTTDPVAATSPVSHPLTVASMLPRLSRSLTPAIAEATFGKPDESVGSGLIIYVYHVEAGKSVYLSFPGFARITDARLQDANGASQELPLVD